MHPWRLPGCADAEASYNLEGLIEEVTKARDTLQEIRRHARQILRYIGRVQDFRRKGREESEEFHRILDKIERLTTKVRHPVLNLIAAYHYQLELYLKRQTVIEIDDMEDKLERLDAQLERGLNYYGELLQAIDLFVKGLEQLIHDLKGERTINNILRDASIPETGRHYAAGREFSKSGRVTLGGEAPGSP